MSYQSPYGTPPGEPGKPDQVTVRPQGYIPNVDINNYLPWTIVLTVVSFMCGMCLGVPFGIAAIVYSVRIDGKVQIGDYQGAQSDSEMVKKLLWIGLGAAVTSLLLWLALFFLPILPFFFLGFS